jgi:GTP-binding protein Era
MSEGHRCGYAAIVGRPNVGKSTLLNALLGQKVSIVAPKPQTTRHRILGILSQDEVQIVFVDTPGIHSTGRRVMNQVMNRSATASLAEADVVLFVVEALVWTDEDARVLERVDSAKRPVIALVNKVDRVKDRARLLPFIDELSKQAGFQDIVPISAEKGIGLEALPKLIERHLPVAPAFFPADQVTDRSERFLAAEIVREKLTWRLRDELPYGIAVEIERFEEETETPPPALPGQSGQKAAPGRRMTIGAVIWVERNGQKAIVIGAGGERLKEIGRLARLELNQLLHGHVHLELWVKVKENWADNEQALRSFGYEE